jgi:hypothetical protein
MATYTLPNGSTYDTSLPYDNQPDLEVYDFTYDMQQTVVPTITTTTGQDPNLPRPTSYTWTETSYPTYNYIIKTEHSYIGNTYKSAGSISTFEIQDK